MKDALKITKGSVLLLADKWVKVRSKKVKRVTVWKRKPLWLSEDQLTWVISIARVPGMLGHEKPGRLENLLQVYPGEIIALLHWVQLEFIKKGRTRGQEIVALRTTVMADMKEYEAGAALGNGGLAAIKNADNFIRRSVKRAQKSTDAKV